MHLSFGGFFNLIYAYNRTAPALLFESLPLWHHLWKLGCLRLGFVNSVTARWITYSPVNLRDTFRSRLEPGHRYTSFHVERQPSDRVPNDDTERENRKLKSYGASPFLFSWALGLSHHIEIAASKYHIRVRRASNVMSSKSFINLYCGQFDLISTNMSGLVHLYKHKQTPFFIHVKNIDCEAGNRYFGLQYIRNDCDAYRIFRCPNGRIN